MARVALVNLASLPMPGNDPIFPIGLRCVQDALDRAGHETRLIDFVETPAALGDLSWAAGEWDVIGFTIRNIDPLDLTCDGHVDHYQAFVARVREVVGRGGPLLVGGGPGYSLFADGLVRRLGFDVGVIGPGEQTILEIVADPDAHRGSGRNLSGARFPGFLANDLQHPHSLMSAYVRRQGQVEGTMIGVETRRKTCYQGCVYCPYAYISGQNQGDLKPLDLIAAELHAIHGSGIRRVFFTDGIFNSELKYAKEVVRTIIEQKLPGLTWSAYFTPKPFDDEFAELLGHSDVEFVVVSPDSLDDGMMKVLGKSFGTRHVTRFIERAKRHGLELRMNVVFGGPGESRASVRATAQYVNANLATEELVMNLGYRVLPETALARQLSLADDDLLDPTFYPFDPDLFSWVIEELDSRFMSTRVLLNLMAARSSSKRMKKVPLPGKAPDGVAANFPYLALTRSRPDAEPVRQGLG
ncbi:B12-binding domain-containing radical SAM protein [Amycolatopsis solani]|uniref:B12-binding domain-containing radical SAM protein n=1 Tax=Amycolatopsis solani TaxID=3028615 RepID=UPI0025AEE4A1|nr:radical SAM protein [Amycolatopsis sp. MEP2-6]